VRHWEGPYTVVKRLSDVTYRIQLTPKSKPKIVHFDRLKKYLGNNAPQWLIKEGGIPIVPVELDVDVELENVDLDNEDLHEQSLRDNNENAYEDSDETILYEVPERLKHGVDTNQSIGDPDGTIIYDVPAELGPLNYAKKSKRTKKKIPVINPKDHVQAREEDISGGIRRGTRERRLPARYRE